MNDHTKSGYATLLNRLSEMQEAPYYATAKQTLAAAEAVIFDLEQKCEHRQAQIDALMLEYCPGEMTHRQLAEWKERQTL